jgi:hypothetical protein
VTFSILYANAQAERDWQQLRKDVPREWELARSSLSDAPHIPTVRTFRLASARLRSRRLGGRTYPQWTYLVDEQRQVWYLLGMPDSSGKGGTVWIVRVVHNPFAGVRV